VYEGDIDTALHLTEDNYAGFFDKERDLYFKLRCRKFIEMIRTRCGENDVSRAKNKSPLRNSAVYFASDADANGSGVFEHQMELDDDYDDEHHDGATNGNAMEISHGDIRNNNAGGLPVITDDELIIYGQELRNEFGGSQVWMKSELDRILGLMAYENPRTSTLGYLLDRRGRDVIAEELNKAILGTFLPSKKL
jgi:Ran-binding protein 9/10